MTTFQIVFGSIGTVILLGCAIFMIRQIWLTSQLLKVRIETYYVDENGKVTQLNHWSDAPNAPKRSDLGPHYIPQPVIAGCDGGAVCG